jgi:hypothetical protein
VESKPAEGEAGIALFHLLFTSLLDVSFCFWGVVLAASSSSSGTTGTATRWAEIGKGDLRLNKRTEGSKIAARLVRNLLLYVIFCPPLILFLMGTLTS